MGKNKTYINKRYIDNNNDLIKVRYKNTTKILKTLDKNMSTNIIANEKDVYNLHTEYINYINKTTNTKF